MLTLCFKAQKLTEEEIEALLTIAVDNILPICQRESICELPLWIVWLSNAQVSFT